MKKLGVLLLLLGAFCAWLGWSLLSGSHDLAAGSSCKAICGLSMLASLLFGATAGALVGGLPWRLACWCWPGKFSEASSPAASGCA
jgi:hypothetical protein